MLFLFEKLGKKNSKLKTTTTEECSPREETLPLFGDNRASRDGVLAKGSREARYKPYTSLDKLRHRLSGNDGI